MKSRVSLAILAIALVSVGCKGGAGSGAIAAGTPVELKLSAAKGDKYTADMTLTMTLSVPKDSKMPADQAKLLAGEQSLTLNATTTSELTDVSDGKYTWVDTITDVKADGKGMMTMMAGMLSQMKGMKTTIVMDSRGKIISQKTEGGPAGASTNSTGQIEGFGFPDKAVKVGDSWDSKVNTGGQDVTMKCTVTEITESSVMIDATMTGVEGLKMNGPMKVVLDRANGRPISTVGEMEVNQGGAIAKMKLDMKRK